MRVSVRHSLDMGIAHPCCWHAHRRCIAQHRRLVAIKLAISHHVAKLLDCLSSIPQVPVIETLPSPLMPPTERDENDGLSTVLVSPSHARLRDEAWIASRSFYVLDVEVGAAPVVGVHSLSTCATVPDTLLSLLSCCTHVGR